jgi:hypothetical protein
MDLSNYRVLDERFRDFEKERQEYEREKARLQVIRIEDIHDVVEPEPPIEAPTQRDGDRPIPPPPPPAIPR